MGRHWHGFMKMQPKGRELDKIYKRRDRYDIPTWQRGRVWRRQKKQALIDTILRGWKLPKMYFLKIGDNPEEFEVVDGQQRLQTIFEFFDNELPLSRGASEFYGGTYYRDLPDDVMDRFDDFEIQYDEITDATDEDLKLFFQRLQAGLPLSASEKLNAVHSNLRDFARELSEHPFLRNKTSVSPHRYGHFDIAGKVATLEIEGLEGGLRYEDMKQTFEANSSFSDQSPVARRLVEAFEALDAIFPDRTSFLRNRAVVQAVATLVVELIRAGSIRGHEATLRAFFETFFAELTEQVELGHDATDPEYLRFQKTVNANVRSGARIRQEVLLRKLLSLHPEFADLLSVSTVAQAGLRTRLPELGHSIGDLISKVNEEYAARTGEDLFKMTNKTVQALRRVGTPVTDFETYEALIDDLYFLVWEGPGQRLAQPPDSFRSIRDLRTDLRHDVNHGEARKVRAKRKKLTQAFRRFAGSASPQTTPPERFPMVQVALMTDIEMDLRQLLNEMVAGARPVEASSKVI